MRILPRLMLILGVIVLSLVVSLRGSMQTPATQKSPPASQDTAARMRNHYGQALTVHAAVIRGDLPAVAAPAMALVAALRTPSSTAGAPEATAAIKTAAEQAAAAKDLASAASATALMLKACGDCHRAVGVMPSASLPTLPSVGGVVGQMQEHQRSMEQMLQSLIVPSNTLWQEGAKGFATTPFHPKDLPVNTADRQRMVRLEDRLHKVASDAVDAPAGTARSTAYATLLEACAGCHREHAKVWGPGRGGG